MAQQLVRELIISGSILFITILVAALAARILARAARGFLKNDNELIGNFAHGLRVPVGGLISIIGIHTALLRISVCKAYITSNEKWFVAAATLLVIYAISQAASIGISWYIKSLGEPDFSGHAALYRKIIMLMIWTFAGVLILDQLGYKITTIIAGLGIAGLAVGLALQDTIANLFSGFYLMVDRSVRPGDYVKLDSGVEGFVDTVGWRNTRILAWANNIILVPNSKLIQSTITNYTLPSPSLSVYIKCGVSYRSDLEQVEQIAVQVAKELIEKVPGADTTYEPLVRFKEFSESNINFTVIMRAQDVNSQYLLQHEYVKALHKRFIEEGIEISLPVRKLIIDGNGKRIEG